MSAVTCIYLNARPADMLRYVEYVSLIPWSLRLTFRLNHKNICPNGAY